MHIIGPEVSLIVPDFTISVHGSSWNYIFFGLILAKKKQKNRQRMKRIENETIKENLHELLYT